MKFAALVVLIAGQYLVNHLNRRAIMKELDDLKTQVAETNTVIDSAIVLIRGLKERLDLALGGGDPVQAIRELRDDLDRKEQELAQAVVAGTPSEGGGTGGETGGGNTGTGGESGGNPSEPVTT